MGEVLLHGETPTEIWDQHEAILSAAIRGDAQAAEALAREHISLASDTLISRLADHGSVQSAAEKPMRRIGRRGSAIHEPVAK